MDGTPGAQRQGIAGIGVVVRGQHGLVLTWRCACAPATTCNEAEYQAVILGLELVAQRYPAAAVWCVSDSRVVVDQLAGRCAVRAAALQSLHRRAMELAHQLVRVSFVAVPREVNRLADALAWEALGGRQALVAASVGRFTR